MRRFPAISLIFLSISVSFHCVAQTESPGLYILNYKSATEDSSRFKALMELCSFYSKVKPDSAFYYGRKAFENASIAENKKNKGAALLKLGTISMEKKQYPAASYYFEKALENIAGETGRDTASALHKTLYELYSRQGNLNKLHFHFEKYIRLRDSLGDQTEKIKLIKLRQESESAQRSALDSIKNEADKKLRALALSKEEELRNSSVFLYLLFIVLIFTLLFSFIFYRKFLSANAKLRAAEGSNQPIANDRTLADSIAFANQLQRVETLSDQLFNNNFSEHFIFQGINEQSSGNYYWISEIKKLREGKMVFEKGQTATKHSNACMIGAFSCSAHGVPGTIIGFPLIFCLNRAVSEKKIIAPEKVMDYLYQRVLMAVEGIAAQSRTPFGIEGALCVFDPDKMELRYSGVNIPVWIIRNGKLIELETDKTILAQITGTNTHFSSNRFEMQKGDQVYLGSTDKALLKSQIIANSEFPMNRQEELLSALLTDGLLIGFKV
ncbi:MAG: hypothetical protein ACJ76F_00060 [Bacteroidia bacterium]